MLCFMSQTTDTCSLGDIGQPSHLHYDMFYLYILPVTFYWCMLGITLLLRMLYVMFCYTSMLMVRYYTVVTYDICAMTSVGR